MAAAKNTSTVKTVQAPKKMAAKTAAVRKDAKKAATPRATSAGKGPKSAPQGDALDVLRLFIKTYANL